MSATTTTPTPSTSLSFIAKSVLVQVIILSSAIIVWSSIPSTALLSGLSLILAVLLSRVVKLPIPWIVMNGALPIAAFFSLTSDISSLYYLAPLIALALIFGPAIRNRVPYFPTTKPAYQALLSELPADTQFSFVDLGCGLAELMIHLARARPNGDFTGVELGILPYILAKIRIKRSKLRNISVECRDIWGYKTERFDFIYTFLSPAVMPRVWDKISREHKSGAVFISNSFPVSAHAEREVKIPDRIGSRLFVYTLKGANGSADAPLKR
jgi:SAM-dependent methyltransferase